MWNTGYFMRIAIDTHFITSGNATGNRTYTAELVQAMISLDTSHEFILYAIEDHPYYHRFKCNSRVTVRNVLSAKGVIRNFISIPRAIAVDRPDVAHLLFIAAPFLKAPVVLTVHDLFYVHDKNVGLYNRVIGQLTTLSILKANKVITISEYSRQDILNYCDVNSSHVMSIPLGIDKKFAPVDDASSVQSKLGIKRDYILYVGRTEDPRKNLPILVNEYSALRKEGAIKEQLVIAGRHGHGTEILFRMVDDLGMNDDILFPGIVHNDDLPALFSGASLFVYISSFEGFGLPVLEAMSCGVPVITSSATSLPEVAGDAAIIISPEKPNELRNAMKLLLNDESLRSSLRKKGFERAKLYNWENVARSTIRVYEEAAGRKY
jgi:glycosyltransferase involved in cell wall biosynthesis